MAITNVFPRKLLKKTPEELQVLENELQELMLFFYALLKDDSQLARELLKKKITDPVRTVFLNTSLFEFLKNQYSPYAKKIKTEYFSDKEFSKTEITVDSKVGVAEIGESISYVLSTLLIFGNKKYEVEEDSITASFSSVYKNYPCELKINYKIEEKDDHSLLRLELELSTYMFTIRFKKLAVLPSRPVMRRLKYYRFSSHSRLLDDLELLKPQIKILFNKLVKFNQKYLVMSILLTMVDLIDDFFTRFYLDLLLKENNIELSNVKRTIILPNNVNLDVELSISSSKDNRYFFLSQQQLIGRDKANNILFSFSVQRFSKTGFQYAARFNLKSYLNLVILSSFNQKFDIKYRKAEDSVGITIKKFSKGGSHIVLMFGVRKLDEETAKLRLNIQYSSKEKITAEGLIKLI